MISIKSVNRNHVPIVIILILAFILRVYNIWIDGQFFFRESTWGMSAWQISEGKLPYRDFFHAQPPLSPFLLGFIFLIFGVGVLQARLFVICVTTFACFMIYHTGKKINTKIGLVGSLIFAIAPISIRYGMFAVNDFVAVTFSIIGFYFLMGAIKRDTFQPAPLKMENIIVILTGISIGLGISIQTWAPVSFHKFMNRLTIGVLCIVGYSFLKFIIERDIFRSTTLVIESTPLILAGIFLSLGVLVKLLLAPLVLAFLIVLVLEGWITGIKIRKHIENLGYFMLSFGICTILCFALFYGIAGDAFIVQILGQHISKPAEPFLRRIDIAIEYLVEENFYLFILFLFSAPFAVRSSYGRGLLLCIGILVATLLLVVPRQYGNYYHAVIPFMAMVCGFFPLPLTTIKPFKLKSKHIFTPKSAKIAFTTALIILIAITNISYPTLDDETKNTIEWLRTNTKSDEYVISDNLNINFRAERRSPFAEISIDRTNLGQLDGEMFIEACYEYDVRVVVSTNRLFGRYDEFDVFLEFLADNYDEIEVGYTIYLRTTPL